MAIFEGVQGPGSNIRTPSTAQEADATWGAGNWVKNAVGAFEQWTPAMRQARDAALPQMDHWGYYGANPMEAQRNRAAGLGPSQANMDRAMAARQADTANTEAILAERAAQPSPFAGVQGSGYVAQQPQAQPPGATGTAATSPMGVLPAAAQPAQSNIEGIDLQALAGPMTGPTAYTPGENAFVSNQLTKLLTSGSPYLERARTRALAGANRRGLLNSSMAMGAGEAAAIDAALPIAQADANTVGGAERYNADIGNTFTRDANTFGRQGALAKLGGMLDQESQARQQAFTRERDASQFANRLREIEAMTAADLQRFDAQQGTNLAGDYRRATEGLYDQYSAAVTRINESDLDPDVKQAQVAELQSLFTSRQAHLNTVYSNQAKWNDAWAQFALEFGQGG
jgi:hypothetical protein